jgi:DNA invertase Pin-like site-specific DNA recombinase
MTQRIFAPNRRHGATKDHRKVAGKSLRSAKCAPLLKAGEILPLGPHARSFGYARVSTEEQNLDVQVTALRDAGVQEPDLYVEKISAVNAKRPIFNLMMKMVERGDVLLLHSLSRVGRELPQILGILGELSNEGVSWRSITEPHLDNSTSSGRLMLNITGAMAQFERDQIVDRTRRGMAERKRQGMWLGRKPKVSDADARKMLTMRGEGMTGDEIASRFPHLKIKPSTVYARTNLLKKKR